MDYLKFVLEFWRVPFQYPRFLPLIVICGIAAFEIWCVWPLVSRRTRARHSFWVRQVVGIAVIIVGVPSCIWAFYYHCVPTAFDVGQIGVVVAEVPGDDPDRSQQIAYVTEINNAFRQKEALNGVAIARPFMCPLALDPETEVEEARKIGRRVNATFILRPLSVGGGQNVWLIVVDPSIMLKPESRLGKLQTSELADLNQLPLPQDMALLAETVSAMSLYKKGQYAEAAKILDDVLAAPKLPEAAPSRAALFFICGNTLMHSAGEEEPELLGKEIGAYRQALRLNAHFPEAHNNLGLALKANGELDEAIAEFRETIRLDPTILAAHSNLGVALRLKGQFGAAIVEDREALRLDPDSSAAHDNLGNALRSNGQLDEAIAEHRKAIRLTPDDPLDHNNLGVALESKGQLDEAIAEYREALRLEPELPQAQYNLERALKEKGPR